MKRDSRSRSRSPANNDSDDPEGSPRRRHDKRKYDRASSGKRVPSDCRVYVSNIPYEFKWQDLKDLFRSEVGKVAYVEMFNDETGRPRGSAIIDFETADIAQKAIEKMHRTDIKGRKLVVKERDEIMHSRDFMFLFNKDIDRERNNRFGNNMDRQRQSFNRGGNSFSNTIPPPPVNYGNTYGLSISFLENLGINGPLVNKVFVANLDYKVTEENLGEVFKVAGKVMNTEVVKDQDNKSRGFGVVEYEHPLQAVQAISMLHNQSYYDRKISVRLDRVAEKHQKDGPSAKLPPGLKGLGMGLGCNGEAITDLNNISNPPMPATNNTIIPAVNTPALGMSGGFNMQSNNMAAAAASMRSAVNAALPMMGMTGMDNLNMGGSNIGMGLGNPLGNAMGAANVMGRIAGMAQNNINAMNPAVQSTNSFANQGIGLPNSNSGGNMFNNSSNFNSSQNQASDFSNNFSATRTVVQISNLPLDYTWKSLKDLCRNYGEIRFAEIKSQGVGWVRFSSEAEARRTSDMLDRQRFDGRMLDACVV